MLADAQEHALGLRLTAVSIDDILATAVRSEQARYRAAGVAVTGTAERRCPLVVVDPDRIQQVLGNLLDNALRHTPAGGQVRIQAAPTRSGEVVIEVTDTGAGIPTDQLEAVFVRFHRVDPARRTERGSGSGLGLTIARAIITDHGGTLTAHSDGPGRGTTMRLTLPPRHPST